MTELTKQINTFNQTFREIRCIKNEFDYLGNGEIIKEDRLEVGKIYHLVHCANKSYGYMVHLEEIPDMYGFQSELFEEMEPYDKAVLRETADNWMSERFESTSAGRRYTWEQFEAHSKVWKNMDMETKRLQLLEADEERGDIYYYHKHLREDGDFELFTGVPFSEKNVRHMRLNIPAFYSIRWKETGAMIGYVGVCEKDQEIEFYIFKPYRRQGFAKEALTMLIRRIFTEGLTVDDAEDDAGYRIIRTNLLRAETRVENTAAIELLKACGFEQSEESVYKLMFSLEDDSEFRAIPIIQFELKNNNDISGLDAKGEISES